MKCIRACPIPFLLFSVQRIQYNVEREVKEYYLCKIMSIVPEISCDLCRPLLNAHSSSLPSSTVTVLSRLIQRNDDVGFYLFVEGNRRTTKKRRTLCYVCPLPPLLMPTPRCFLSFNTLKLVITCMFELHFMGRFYISALVSYKVVETHRPLLIEGCHCVALFCR